VSKPAYTDLTPEAIKGLKSWQLYTLASDNTVLGVFIDGLEFGNADTGEYFSSPVAAFFQALRMCGRKSLKLREAYERNRTRRQNCTSSTNDAAGGEGKKKG
jgi:hypothetical protein